MEHYPPFVPAVKRFRAFLRWKDVAGDIAWVTAADAVLLRSRIFVRLPEPAAARECAEHDYQRACGRRLGVELGVLCLLEGKICCFVYAPHDEDEATRHLMPDGLKLTLPVPVPEGELAISRLEWLLAKSLSHRWETQKLSLFHQEAPEPAGPA